MVPAITSHCTRPQQAVSTLWLAELGGQAGNRTSRWCMLFPEKRCPEHHQLILYYQSITSSYCITSASPAHTVLPVHHQLILYYQCITSSYCITRASPAHTVLPEHHQLILYYQSITSSYCITRASPAHTVLPVHHQLILYYQCITSSYCITSASSAPISRASWACLPKSSTL